jgi:hypothetical protein
MRLANALLRHSICAACVISPAILTSAFGQTASPRGMGSAALTVQVGLLEADGSVAPPQSATVYILYGSWTPNAAGTQENGSETAGGQFRLRFSKLLSEDRELKNLQKRGYKTSGAGNADEIAGRALKNLDEALVATRDWLAQHPDRAWQLRTVSPDRHGEWTTTGLDPGPYEIIARGKIADYDADWEATVNLRSEMTLTLPMTSPRFITRADK